MRYINLLCLNIFVVVSQQKREGHFYGCRSLLRSDIFLFQGGAMYEELKITIVMLSPQDIVCMSDGFGGEWSDENVDPEGWV